MSKADNVPDGECPQCWRHAYDKSIHRALPRDARQCDACVACKAAGHPGTKPKRGWW